MKELTRTIRTEYGRDYNSAQKISLNRSKFGKRTREQNLQSFNDRFKNLEKKWNSFKSESETEAQMMYCKRMLDQINRGRDLIKLI